MSTPALSLQKALAREVVSERIRARRTPAHRYVRTAQVLRRLAERLDPVPVPPRDARRDPAARRGTSGARTVGAC